jgi:uncharacterized damage-inducible protein DinB
LNDIFSHAIVARPTERQAMSARQITGQQEVVRMMTHYMAWANKVMLESVSRLPPAEIVKPRAALFGNIAHTFNHILVIEDIFRCHLEGRPHGYKKRNTEVSPPFEELRTKLETMDLYYVELAERSSSEALDETIEFEFVGGGDGAMTRQEILLHLVNHATYHRGFISDMLSQVPFSGDANDLSVFLRDAWPSLRARQPMASG